MTYTAYADITDTYGEQSCALTVVPDDLPPMEPSDGHEEMRTQFLVNGVVGWQQSAIKEAEGLLAVHRWQPKGTWRPTNDGGYTVAVERT